MIAAAHVVAVLMMLNTAIPSRLQIHQGESEASALLRYHLVATAIADEAGDDTALIVMMVSVARWESALWEKIHSGEMLGDHGHSRGLFQLYFDRGRNERVPRTKYVAHQIVGTDYASTRRMVHAAAIWMRPIVKGCGQSPRCLFMRYGGLTPKQMTPDLEKEIAKRVRTWLWMRNLAAAEKKKRADSSNEPR